MPMPRSQRLLPLLFLAFFVGGCGGPKYPASTVTGRVTIDGAPVPKGYITFSPTDGTAGPVVGAPIHDGEYRCELVPQGKLHVTFIAQAAEPMTIFDKANNTNRLVPKDILPPACQQGQTLDVTAGDNQHNFDLKSKPPQGPPP